MTWTTRTVLSALVVAFTAAIPAVATEEIAKHEDLRCSKCHERRDNHLLNHKGKYYEYKRSLEGYDRLLRKFKKCTVCHAKQPGSAELTHTGMELKNRDVTMDHLSAPDPVPEKRKKKSS